MDSFEYNGRLCDVDTLIPSIASLEGTQRPLVHSTHMCIFFGTTTECDANLHHLLLHRYIYIYPSTRRSV